MQLTRERGYGAEFDPLEHSGPGQDLVHTGSVGLPLGPLVDVVAVQVLRVIRLSFPVQPGCIGSATRDPFDVDHFRVSSHLNSPIRRAGPPSWSSSSPAATLHVPGLRASTPLSPALAPIKAYRLLESLPTCQLQMPSLMLWPSCSRPSRQMTRSP